MVINLILENVRFLKQMKSLDSKHELKYFTISQILINDAFQAFSTSTNDGW